MNNIHWPKQILPDRLFANLGLVRQNAVRHGVREFSDSDRIKSATCTIESEPKQDVVLCAIASFAHYRDVKVILENLTHAGLPAGWITVIARDGRHRDWMPGLKVCDRLEEIGWDVLRENLHFWQSFQKGKYSIVVVGSDDAILFAKNIFSQRPGAEVQVACTSLIFSMPSAIA